MTDNRKIMTGDEAVARGAWEAGAKVAAAYPGTPSTEILENIALYDEIYAEWSPNEKVALEVAGLEGDARLDGHDLSADDQPGVHFSEFHANQVDQPDAGARGQRPDPQAEEL